ncbi:unnamed protein product [Cuscuta campestris]|uniref:Uncharacterized protein n=1 Tax=Cuscuta campestris TaxID=132261 RepID=A0A484NA31_9ASTE|nr:unnamed protein product [Cuscuta campestris]
MYREGKYEEALEFYTDALSLAKTKPQKIALHSNRAACFLKLLLFNKVIACFTPSTYTRIWLIIFYFWDVSN